MIDRARRRISDLFWQLASRLPGRRAATRRAAAARDAEAVARTLRPAGFAPFVVLVVLLLLQLISPAQAWSWPLAGLAVMLAGS